MWYLLKTWKGREEDLVKEIRRTVPPYLYHEAFVIYNERIWRRQGQNIVHVEPLFQGCVFLTCKETEPLFRRLERVPAMSRLMAVGDFSVYPLMEEDAEFLERLSGEDHVVRFSYALRDEMAENVYRVSGPMEICLPDIDSLEFRKRFVKLHRTLWGEDRIFALGIVLKEDMEQGIVYENLKIPVELPQRYSILEIGRDEEGNRTYTSKGKMAMLPGVYGRERERVYERAYEKAHEKVYEGREITAKGNGMKKNYA